MMGKASVTLGVCTIRSAQCFAKFITELIEVGFLIIRTNAYRLRSVFRHITVRFFAVGLIDLVGLKLFFYFSDNTNTKIKSKNITNNFSQQPAIHKNIFQLILIQIILSYLLLN